MTFGTDLKQLSLSVDGIYEGQMAKINRIIETYTKKTLNIQSTSVFIVTQENDQVEPGRYKLGSLNLPGLEITEEAKKELTLIAETISFMFGLYEAREINSKHTDLAIDRDDRESTSSPPTPSNKTNHICRFIK